MGANAWDFRYGKNMPAHPSPLSGGVWAFSLFGNMQVDYLLTKAGNVPRARLMSIGLVLEVDNGAMIKVTDGGTAGITFMMQRAGDNLSGVGKYADYRLWASGYRLAVGGASGSYSVSIPIARDNFTNVNGQRPSSSGWSGMLGNMKFAGLTFGGMFAGHGWECKGGAARISLLNWDAA